MEKMNDLRDLLKHEIEDLQSVEDQILEALPKMIDKANNSDLKKALQEHLQITEQHKSRLEKIMKQVTPGNEANGKKKGILGIFGGKQECKGMKGIIEEGQKIMSSDISPKALDAAIIASAQKIEHYEICGYGTARTFAKELGMEQVARQLEQTLNEEYEADDILTSLALMGINEEAETKRASSPSASSKGRSSGRVKEKANSEMEMEPVNSSTRSSGRSQSSASNSRQTNGQPKSSDSSRNKSGKSSSISKRTGDDRRSSSANDSNGRSERSERGGSSKNNSRGKR